MFRAINGLLAGQSDERFASKDQKPAELAKPAKLIYDFQ